MTQVEAQGCKPVRTMTDVRVEAELNMGQFESLEEDYKALRDAVADLNRLLRDHASTRSVRLRVDPTYEVQCSACHAPWEPYDEDGVTRCANCGALVAKEAAAP